MAHTNYTPQLTASACFTFDGNGNLKMLEGTAATLQNVSNECRCFTDDLYFYAEHGIDWFSDQLGKPVQKAVTRALRVIAENVATLDAARRPEADETRCRNMADALEEIANYLRR